MNNISKKFKRVSRPTTALQARLKEQLVQKDPDFLRQLTTLNPTTLDTFLTEIINDPTHYSDLKTLVAATFDRHDGTEIKEGKVTELWQINTATLFPDIHADFTKMPDTPKKPDSSDAISVNSLYSINSADFDNSENETLKEIELQSECTGLDIAKDNMKQLLALMKRDLHPRFSKAMTNRVGLSSIASLKKSAADCLDQVTTLPKDFGKPRNPKSVLLRYVKKVGIKNALKNFNTNLREMCPQTEEERSYHQGLAETCSALTQYGNFNKIIESVQAYEKALGKVPKVPSEAWLAKEVVVKGPNTHKPTFKRLDLLKLLNDWKEFAFILENSDHEQKLNLILKISESGEGCMQNSARMIETLLENCRREFLGGDQSTGNEALFKSLSEDLLGPFYNSCHAIALQRVYVGDGNEASRLASKSPKSFMLAFNKMDVHDQRRYLGEQADAYYGTFDESAPNFVKAKANANEYQAEMDIAYNAVTVALRSFTKASHDPLHAFAYLNAGSPRVLDENSDSYPTLAHAVSVLEAPGIDILDVPTNVETPLEKRKATRYESMPPITSDASEINDVSDLSLWVANNNDILKSLKLGKALPKEFLVEFKLVFDILVEDPSKRSLFQDALKTQGISLKAFCRFDIFHYIKPTVRQSLQFKQGLDLVFEVLGVSKDDQAIFETSTLKVFLPNSEKIEEVIWNEVDDASRSLGEQFNKFNEMFENGNPENLWAMTQTLSILLDDDFISANDFDEKVKKDLEYSANILGECLKNAKTKIGENQSLNPLFDYAEFIISKCLFTLDVLNKDDNAVDRFIDSKSLCRMRVRDVDSDAIIKWLNQPERSKEDFEKAFQYFDFPIILVEEVRKPALAYLNHLSTINRNEITDADTKFIRTFRSCLPNPLVANLKNIEDYNTLIQNSLALIKLYKFSCISQNHRNQIEYELKTVFDVTDGLAKKIAFSMKPHLTPKPGSFAQQGRAYLGQLLDSFRSLGKELDSMDINNPMRHAFCKTKTNILKLQTNALSKKERSSVWKPSSDELSSIERSLTGFGFVSGFGYLGVAVGVVGAISTILLISMTAGVSVVVGPGFVAYRRHVYKQILLKARKEIRAEMDYFYKLD